jgi:diguanylate cyclase
MSEALHPIAFTDFESACRAVMKLLRARYGFGLWMVTRVEGDDWIVLHAEDTTYGLEEHRVLRWGDTFCYRMINEDAPRMAAATQQVPAYANAPVGGDIEIGAYIGVPLTREDGSLFGTLCAIDKEEHPEIGEEDLPVVETFAQLLSTVLNFELKAVEEARRADRVESESLLDPLTGLRNRRGWDQKMHEEEIRAQRLGSPICVFSIDLDDLKLMNDNHGHAQGDQLIRRAANAITASLREIDVAARVGGDEFTILALECSEEGSGEILERLQTAFKSEGVIASIGKAMRNPEQGLDAALADADKEMYRMKAERKARPRKRV